MPKQRDTITQTELAAVVAAHRLTYTLIWNLRQRLLNGVRVDPGPYSIKNEPPDDPPENKPQEFDCLGMPGTGPP